ncbi:hypothetical protein GLOIN_2v1838168 [Rhizophagus irregularis DAOM 181602=DAOM 197198]|nr:hypothetical protein GLOIN_2v1838168 [Rhizophagus irregularis DAOM 181602=DAOM 197198]
MFPILEIQRKPNISPKLFNIILRFIYCGNIDLKNLQGLEVLNLLIAVDELNIHSLISYIQEFLIEHRTEFLYQNPTVPNIKPKTNLTPSRDPDLKDSTLIKSSHISLFASWIDKKGSSHYNKKNIPYEFKLLYRSSRDGNGTDSFHENCDNKGPTIWVAKIKDSIQLIGGYNPLDWNGNTWKTTADSFIFNFTNGKSISTAELGYVNNTRYAVYCDDVYGPTMGNLQCNNNNWSYYGVGGCYHPKLGIPTGFTVEEYEVFQVIKKTN